MTIEGITVSVPRLEPLYLLGGLPRFNSMTVPASRIHEFAECNADKTDHLVYLAHNDVLVMKIHRKQSEQPRQSQQLPTLLATQKVVPEVHWKKIAVGLYKKLHPGNAGILAKRKKVSKHQITGMVENTLYKDGVPAGIMHAESVTLCDFKAYPEKTKKVYHRIQALLYAGVYQYCDYVQYCKDKEEICVHLVVPDGNWQTTIVPRAQRYCQYFDFLWRKVLEVN